MKELYGETQAAFLILRSVDVFYPVCRFLTPCYSLQKIITYLIGNLSFPNVTPNVHRAMHIEKCTL